MVILDDKPKTPNMKYFKELLSKTNIEIFDCLPLWKVIERMTDEDLQGLVDYIDDCLGNNVEPKYFSHEVCLFYAYWWHKKYSGGSGGRNYNDAPKDLRLRHRSEHDIALLKKAMHYELAERQFLEIPILQKTNKQWLDSVFAQGGIPMQWLLGGKGVAEQLTSFLKSLVLYYKNEDIPDWTDTSEAIELAKTRLNGNMAESEAFCGACLYYAKAIIENDETNIATDVEILRNLLNRVKRETASFQETRDRFTMDWFLDISDGNTARLAYSLKAPEQIPVSEDNNFHSRRYYLNDNYIADYIRYKDNFTLQRNTNLPKFRHFNEGESFFLQYSEENQGHLHSVNIVNGISPTIDEPVILSYCESNYWSFNNIKDSKKAVFYPSRWTPCFPTNNPQTFLFDGNSFSFAKINTEDDLIFSENSGNRITLKQQTQQYYLNVRFPSLNWIESSTQLLVSHNVDFKKHISILDESGEIVRKGWNIESRDSEGYKEYHPGVRLDYGIHVFRIKLPDGRSRYIKLFITDDIVVNTRPGTMTIEFVSELKIQTSPNVKCEGSLFSLIGETELNHISIKLWANGTYADVDIALPQDSSFWDIGTGKRLSNNDIISVSQLHHYKVYQSGNDKLSIKMVEKDEEGERALVSTQMQWAADERYTLSYLGGEIEKIIALYPLTRSRKLKLTIGKNSLKIRAGSYSIYTDSPNHALILKKNDIECPEDIPVGIIRTDTIFTDSIEEILIKNDGNGIYHVPAEINEFIVYSLDPARSFTPQLVDYTERYVHQEYQIERRNNRKENSIEEWISYLGEGNGDWDRLWKLWEITRDRQLNYNTFNAIVALSEQPTLLARFITQLLIKYPNINLSETTLELERMERELGFAFHTIPFECWQDAIKILKEKNKENEQQAIEAKKILEGIAGIDVNTILKAQEEKTEKEREEEFLNEKCELYFRLLERQFGDYVQLIYLYHIFGFTLAPVNCKTEQEYASMISGMYLSENSTLKIPDDIRIPGDYILSPFCKLSSCPSLLAKMRFFAIAVPQYAAYNAKNLDPDFWKYTDSSAFVKRMINYTLQFAPDVYRDLFCATLLNQA